MRIKIHRGTKEIGGTCIEVEAQGKRIALDVGLPLDASDDEHEGLLPLVSGFRETDESLLGVFISHPHQDHYGLARHIRADVPVYIGERANSILQAASEYVPNGHAFVNPRYIAHRKPVKTGPFLITPYLVDHSAFDAYGFLVEADGKRVYYSGDVRGHGRKSGLFDSMIARPPRDVDVLLMEGTTIGRVGTSKGFETEGDLENRFVEAFEQTKGLHFVWASSQNIDRIVSIFRAAKRSNRVLIIDLYTAVVLGATEARSIPKSHWKDVKLYVPGPQRVFVAKKTLFGDLKRHSRNRIFPEHLGDWSARAVMLFRPMMTRDRDIEAVLSGARLSYSMWAGYLEEKSTERIRDWLKEKRIPLEIIHTSGHASVVDLQRFAAALAPRRLVPIHSFETGRFGEFFQNVDRQEDGVWWDT